MAAAAADAGVPPLLLAPPHRSRTTSTTTQNEAVPLLLSSTASNEPAEAKATARLIFAACIAAAGSSFQFGYHVGDYGAAAVDINVLGRAGHHKNFQSIYMQYFCELGGFLLGGLIGALCGGALANRLGRKGTLLLNDFIFVAGALLMTFAKFFWLWIFGRFVVGFGSGIGTIVVPVYCAEISPARLRGSMTTAHQLFFALGVLVAALLSMKAVLGSDMRWPLLLGVSASLAIAHFFLFLFCPESPRYLYSRGVEVSTVDSLQRLRGQNNVDAELKEMHLEMESERGLQNMGYIGLLRTPYLRRALGIGAVLHMGQQMSGMNALIIYSADVFASSSIQAPDTDLALIGGINFLVTLLLSIWLLDRVGRRPLLQWSYAAMALMYVLLALSALGAKHSQSRTVALFIIIAIVIAYAVGPGPVTWVTPVEIFPLTVRTQMLSICVCVNWVFQCVCLSVFLVLKNIIGSYTMYVFALLCAGFAIFSYKFVPETANSTANEALSLLGHLPSYSETNDLWDKDEPEVVQTRVPPLRAVISPTSSYHSA